MTEEFEQYVTRPYSFLLDSAKGGGRSLYGADPALVFEARRCTPPGPHAEACIRLRRGTHVEEYTGRPFDELQRLIDRMKSGGAVGYFSYEAGRFIETIPDLERPGLDVPDIHFAFYGQIFACDPVPSEGTSFDQEPLSLPDRVSLHPGQYADAVRVCKDHIYAGDVFQVCLTHQMQQEFRGNAWQLYKCLRAISPAPFAAYLNFGAAQIVSASPERFLRLGVDRIVESRPIKGTRPRGKTPEEDSELRHELATSIKDRAENIMIVDLVRNDLGRVCEIGSVQVAELMQVEEYATVFQLVSTVRGKLRPDCSPMDLVRAAFPPGSMTGAPKIEAMKIIERVEPVRRGIYSGAIGYIDHTGAMDLSVVIRTGVVQDGVCCFNAGGAVVSDSDPQAEYQEAMDKAYAMRLALAKAST